MADAIRWTHAEMIETACEWWADPAIVSADCDVIETEDDHGDTCLVVLHEPTGRTSAEAGGGGRWHTDGTAYEV